MGITVQEVVIDCTDPAALARFWAGILGVRWAALDEGWAVVDASPVMLAFQKVPEPKQSPKNRLHLDVRVRDARHALVRAERLGAVRTGRRELDAHGDGYVVLRDPEANELCFVVDEQDRWSATLARALETAPAPRHLWHLATVTDWHDALDSGTYRASTRGATFDQVGFVHTSYPRQLPAVARAVYRGSTEAMCVLVLDADTIEADGVRVVEEDGGDGERYPHVYAALDPAWVVDVRPAAFDATGHLVVLD
ncbi:MAG: DUF952 domain-containing protein [Cellulomonas sp.]|nr:DUF952 domain-containing protein [Cellulomonas sp.]